MVPGTPVALACPSCGDVAWAPTLLSGNTFAVLVWSDGKVHYPMLPRNPPITKCADCGTLYHVDDAHRTGRRATPRWWIAVATLAAMVIAGAASLVFVLAIGVVVIIGLVALLALMIVGAIVVRLRAPSPVEARAVAQAAKPWRGKPIVDPPAEDYLRAIEEGLARGRAEEVWLRTCAWTRFHDRVRPLARGGAVAIHDSPVALENATRLSAMLGGDKSDRILRGAIALTSGDSAAAIEALGPLESDAEVGTIALALADLARRGDGRLRLLELPRG